MAKSIEDGFKDIFLAGVGALALTGEKAKEVVDTLIEKGNITVEQGKDINQELQHKAAETISKVREETVAQALKTMSPEEREEFVATVSRLVAESNAATETEVVETETEAAEAVDADAEVAAEKPAE